MSMGATISLRLEGKTCQIIIGNGILGDVGELVPAADKFAIICNPKVASLYGDTVTRSFASSGLEHEIFLIPDSEESKSLDVANGIYSKLADAGFDRNGCIIGLGGGAVGDLAGFVAATYMRGVGLVQIPTTLLAQVDSAIGGKTGVNIPAGKNLVGAFHQPALVVSDVSVLGTLPERDFRSGLAEVIKYGIISDAEMLSLDVTKLKGKDSEMLEDIVARCSSIKAGIVQEDERDTGRRIILNLGHTLGHALESASGYGYSHGEAVAIGMVFAARISVMKGLMAESGPQKISGLLASAGLPVRIDEKMEIEKLMDFMQSDKKSRSGKIYMVLPTGIGTEPACNAVEPELIVATLGEMMA
jgi:3-dehydroquinate synthase